MSQVVWQRTAVVLALISATVAPASAAEKKAKQSKTVRHQVVGLFSIDRKADLRKVIKEIEKIDLVSIDFKRAEIELTYDAEKLFGKAKPEEIIRRLDRLLKSQSNQTFGIKARRTLADDKLKQVSIAVGGLDCRACSYGAYRAIYQIEGVEMATASFKLGVVTATIDSKKTDRAALETALEKRGAKIKK